MFIFNTIANREYLLCRRTKSIITITIMFYQLKKLRSVRIKCVSKCERDCCYWQPAIYFTPHIQHTYELVCNIQSSALCIWISSLIKYAHGTRNTVKQFTSKLYMYTLKRARKVKLGQILTKNSPIEKREK